LICLDRRVMHDILVLSVPYTKWILFYLGKYKLLYVDVASRAFLSREFFRQSVITLIGCCLIVNWLLILLSFSVLYNLFKLKICL